MKEELPSILISDGWETDANDKLIEVVIPSTVDTYQAPTKVTFKGETLNWIPSTATVLQEFEFHGITYIGTILSGYNNLVTVYFPNCETLGQTTSQSNGEFYNCTKLANVNMPKLKTINMYNTSGSVGTFAYCSGLTSITLPELLTINQREWAAPFLSCTALTTVNFPKLQTISTTRDAGPFTNCNALQSVTFGSNGHAVTSLSNYTFKNCTQSGLTITIYTSGGTALSGAPWGATNATIVYETA